MNFLKIKINKILFAFFALFFIHSFFSYSSVPENQNWKDFFSDKQIWDMGPINRIAAKNDKLFVSGFFSLRRFDSLRFNGIAELKDSVWLPLGNGDSAGIKGLLPFISDILINDSLLIVVGLFDSAGNMPARNIAYWNINSRQWIPKGYGTNGGITSIEAINDRFYIAGRFDTLTTTTDTIYSNIVKFSGNQWDSLSIGLNNTVLDMAAHNNLLYVVGSFDSIGVIPAKGIGIWDDSLGTWATFGNNGPLGTLSTVCKVGNDIYFGGEFDFLKTGNDTIPCKNIARWNGASWDTLVNGIDGDIFEMKTDGENLFVAGSFSKLFDDTLNCQNIVSWDGANWHSFGSGTNEFCYSVEPKGDTLFVGGAFYFTGDKLAERIGIWNIDNLYYHKLPKDYLENIHIVENNIKIKCFPNPSSNEATIEFYNNLEGVIEITLLDMSGIVINTITSKKYDVGWHNINFSIIDYKSGSYLCKLKHSNGLVTIKLIIIR